MQNDVGRKNDMQLFAKTSMKMKEVTLLVLKSSLGYKELKAIDEPL